MPAARTPAAMQQQLAAGGRLADALVGAVEADRIVDLLRHDVGLTQATIAACCGVSERTVRSWEGGGARIRQRHDDRLRALALVVGALLGALSARGCEQWLRGRHPRLDRARPMELLGDDRLAVVLDAAHALAGGSYV